MPATPVSLSYAVKLIGVSHVINGGIYGSPNAMKTEGEPSNGSPSHGSKRMSLLTLSPAPFAGCPVTGSLTLPVWLLGPSLAPHQLWLASIHGEP